MENEAGAEEGSDMRQGLEDNSRITFRIYCGRVPPPPLEPPCKRARSSRDALGGVGEDTDPGMILVGGGADSHRRGAQESGRVGGP